MGKVWVIFRREFGAIFFSPIAYVVMTVYLIAAGYFFFVILIHTREASLRYVLANMGITVLFLSPLLTMRLLSEEMRSGTIETLMTDPVTDAQVIAGKYLAVFGFYLVLLAPTWLYVVILSAIGNPDMGPIVSGYVGLVAMGSVFLSIGLLASSISKNQIVAGVAAFVALLLLWIIGWATGSGATPAAKALAYLSFFDHFDEFRKGVIDTKDLFYFLSMTVLSLLISVRVLAVRKWR